MTGTARPRLQVRGECPKCQRKHNRFAQPGKATVKIGCQRAGCDGQVTLRRVDDKTAVTPPERTEPPAPAPGTKQSKVERIRGYRRDDESKPQPARRPAAKVERPDEPNDAGDGGQPVDDGAGPGDDDGAGRQRKPVRVRRPETGRKRHPYSHLGFDW